MQIRLDLIVPSPHPLRTSWDEDKMAELAQSVREQGIIVPIKVRPTDTDLCEIVYGHRRVEAARRAGLSDIPAIVEGMDDVRALLQQIIENEQREDVPYEEKAIGYQRAIQQTGWSGRELSRRTGVPNATIHKAIQWLDARNQGAAVRIDTQEDESDYNTPGVQATLEIARSLGDDIEARRKIADKVSRERLPRYEARTVADAYREAEDDAEREAILETDYHDPAFQRLVRVKSEVKRETARREQKQRQENPREVKQYIEAVQTFSAAVELAIKVAVFGKFSPEAGRFIKGWHDSIREGLARLEQTWEV